MAVSWGFAPIVVENGTEALAVLQSPDAPMLALLDWEMPGSNGPDVCRTIREQENENPPYIILLTARSGAEFTVKGLEAGANDFVSKPFNEAELLARVNVGKRMVLLQEQLRNARDLLAEERSVIEDTILAMRNTRHFDGSGLRALQAPVERTSGDVLFAARRPDGAQHVFLGDFTGHGLNAAIGGPIASDVFYQMTLKGLEAASILAELNSHIAEKLPVGIFLAAVMVEIAPNRRQGRVFNCGMQDVLVFRAGSEFQRIPSGNVALGILPSLALNVVGVDLQPDDRVFAYSDGFVETLDHDGKQFGIDGLASAIARVLRSGDDLALLRSAALKHGRDTNQSDDMTLVEMIL